jgi:hypothetical protein
MRFRTVGNKYDVAFVVVRNSLTSAIPAGAPVFYVMNGTNDGLDVTNANAAAGAGQEFLAGIAVNGLAASSYGEAQVFGLCSNTRVVTATRTASTDSYNSFTAIVSGDVAQINTLTSADAISRSAAGAATAVLPNIVFVGAYTSTASQSSSFDTTSRTAITTTLKTFLRII